jgi:hypothetical protein
VSLTTSSCGDPVTNNPFELQIDVALAEWNRLHSENLRMQRALSTIEMICEESKLLQPRKSSCWWRLWSGLSRIAKIAKDLQDPAKRSGPGEAVRSVRNDDDVRADATEGEADPEAPNLGLSGL